MIRCNALGEPSRALTDASSAGELDPLQAALDAFGDLPAFHGLLGCQPEVAEPFLDACRCHPLALSAGPLPGPHGARQGMMPSGAGARAGGSNTAR